MTSPPEPLTMDNPLWDTALELWRTPAFAQTCLELQGRGWRVSHLLVACYLGRVGHRWEGQEPASIRQWRESMTEALRQRRQDLPKSRTDLQALRKALAEAELEAERVELAMWYQALPQDHRSGHCMADNLIAAAPNDAEALAAESLLLILIDQLAPQDDPIAHRLHLTQALASLAVNAAPES